MNQKGDGENEDRSGQAKPAPPTLRHRALVSPDEPKRLEGSELAKHLRHEAMQIAGIEVLIPCAVLLTLGLAALGVVEFLLPGSSTLNSLGEAFIVGALVTGGFGWAGAMNSAITAERDRQIDLGSAASLDHADLAGLELTGMYLRHRQLPGVRMSQVNAHGIDLHGANLMDARFTDAVLHEADFTNANMRRAGCFGADFTGADLRGARLDGASLGNAVLSRAKLQGAKLKHADLRGADLTGAFTDDATALEGAWVDEGTKLPLDLVANRLGEELALATPSGSVLFDLTVDKDPQGYFRRLVLRDQDLSKVRVQRGTTLDLDEDPDAGSGVQGEATWVRAEGLLTLKRVVDKLGLVTAAGQAGEDRLCDCTHLESAASQPPGRP